MESFWLLLIVSVVAVGLFVLGLSLTFLVKGRHMQSDISDNDAMRARGIECAAAQMRREEAVLRGDDGSSSLGCGKGVCSDCAVKDSVDKDCQ